jgi:hypothetical protein
VMRRSIMAFDKKVEAPAEVCVRMIAGALKNAERPPCQALVRNDAPKKGAQIHGPYKQNATAGMW